jgi:hypothetical protein
VGLVDHPHDVLLVPGLTGQGDLIFGLAIGGPVDPGRAREWDGSPNGGTRSERVGATLTVMTSTRDPPCPSMSFLVHPHPSSHLLAPRFGQVTSVRARSIGSGVRGCCDVSCCIGTWLEPRRRWLGFSEQFCIQQCLSFLAGHLLSLVLPSRSSYREKVSLAKLCARPISSILFDHRRQVPLPDICNRCTHL